MSLSFQILSPRVPISLKVLFAFDLKDIWLLPFEIKLPVSQDVIISISYIQRAER